MEFVACMNQAGVSVLVDSNAGYADLGPVMSSLVPDDLSNIPATVQDPAAKSEEWQRLLDAEQEVLDAEWACRSDVYERSVMDLAPVIEEFAEQHSAAILEAEAAWEDKVEEAARLGYDGSQVGPLGK